MSMDQITIKTPNPKCRISWCLIEFIDWKYCQPCWYSPPLLWTSAPLTFSLVHLPHPPPPSLCEYWISTGICNYSVCNRGWRGLGCVVSKYRRMLSILYTRIQCVQYMGFWASRQINTCRKFHYTSIFLDDDIFQMLLWVLSFHDISLGILVSTGPLSKVPQIEVLYRTSYSKAHEALNQHNFGVFTLKWTDRPANLTQSSEYPDHGSNIYKDTKP